MILPEISILKLFLSKEVWQKYRDSLEIKDFPKDLQPVARLLYAHYDNDGDILSISDLSNLFFATNPPNRDFMVEVFGQIEKDISSPETVLTLIRGVHNKGVLQEISLAAYDASEGRKSTEDVLRLYDRLVASEESPEEEDEFQFVSSDLETLADKAILKPGLRWRLNTLNSMFGSLRLGDFGFLFARPETGKTTFLASEVTHMAGQTNQPILWFNNEEQGDKVMLRCIQAALGIPMEQLLSDLKGNKKRYQDLTNDNLKLLDNAQITQAYVERACERFKPSLIVFDQIDKIQTAEADREDLRLGSIYQWGRELAKRYAPVIGVCQADGTGENVKWLTMAHVANAKTAKQAEADWILGIGKTTDAGYDNIRFLHASKNKLMGDADTDPSKRHGRETVILDAHIARYRDVH